MRLGSSTEYARRDSPLDEEAALSTGSLFGASKAAGSLLLLAQARMRGLAAVVLRAFQVYDPGDHRSRFVPAVLHAAHTGDVVPLTEPGRCRDWVWVGGDVVDACVRAASAEVGREELLCNIGTGVQTWNEGLVRTDESPTGCRIRTVTGAHPGGDWDSAHWSADVRRAPAVLGWEPTVDLETGLRLAWEAERSDEVRRSLRPRTAQPIRALG